MFGWLKSASALLSEVLTVYFLTHVYRIVRSYGKHVFLSFCELSKPLEWRQRSVENRMGNQICVKAQPMFEALNRGNRFMPLARQSQDGI